ncbi:MAG: Ig-like domain-containing protein [Lachnospiraceae bacterium]|nr:Ig-like domain-containing protein [Lachnospiraceae bacterium]
MKSRFQKTITSLLLIAALAFSGISYQGKEAKAADAASKPGDLLDTEISVATKGVPVSHEFTTANSNQVSIGIYVLEPVSLNCTITSATTQKSYPITILSTDTSAWGVTSEGVPFAGFYFNGDSIGKYTLSITFDADTPYSVYVYQNPVAAPAPTPGNQTPVKTPTPYLNAQNVTVTAGFSQTISVSNASDAITWSSSNQSVATVSNGKITGKKAGTATITAKTAGGYTMTCNVTVKKNVYSVKKLGVKKVTYGKSGIDIYNVSYDKKGNLVIKTRVLNNSSYKLQELRNVKIKIKDNNGKAIGTYSVKKIKKVNLKAGKAKSYTFKIKKAKLKNKKANLPLITTSVSGKAYYIR